MDYSQLRTFVAVARHGHLTRAAESLHLSQPALSGHIKALEEALGVALFRRTPSGMEITPSGRLLLDEAERALAGLQRVQETAQRLRGELSGKLTLGTVLDPAVLRVGQLLALAIDRYPQLELELHQVVSHEALTGIREGSLDASFYFGVLPEPDLTCVPLREIIYRVAFPIAWKDELQDAPWDALAARPWIVAPQTSSHRGLVLQTFEGRTPLPERLIEADNESVIANLIESGVGVSLIRDEIALASVRAGRVGVWTGAQGTTQLWFVYPASREGDPLLQAVRTLLAELWAAPSPDEANLPARPVRAAA